jgi:sugar-specific transcriptional regulator TrmB
VSESLSEDDERAVTVLERLGLSNYEALVFVALQRLGTGTARDVHEETDIPRSQVYGAADELESRGLISVQQSRPKRYHPSDLAEAREQLTDTFERDRRAAFNHLERVRDRADQERDDEREDVWTTTGSEGIDARMLTLLRQADHRVLLATDDEAYLPEELFDIAQAFDDTGGDIAVVSRSAAVRERFQLAGVDARSLPSRLADVQNDRSARLMLVDDATLLLSVRGNNGTETAIWSEETTVARVIGGLIEQAILDE